MKMSTLTKRERPVFGELLDWLDGEFRALPAVTSAALGRGFRVEDYAEDGHYVVRAELPGLDPAKDVEVLVRHGVLTVNAERREERREGRRSEFHYGAFTRSVMLPQGADENDVVATYTDGILLVRVGLTGEQQPQARKVPITTATEPRLADEPVPAAEG
jgi:HSP20 family protein